MSTPMPIMNPITDSNVDVEKVEYFEAIINKRTNRLRATPPKNNPKAEYVWRWVAFYCSPKRNHQCLPMISDIKLACQLRDTENKELTIEEEESIVLHLNHIAAWITDNCIDAFDRHNLMKMLSLAPMF